MPSSRVFVSVFVSSLVLLSACQRSAKSDFKKYCDRLHELETGGEATKLLKSPADRYSHSAIAAAIVMEEDGPSSTGKGWLEALTVTSAVDHRGIIESSAQEHGVQFECAAFDNWANWYGEEVRKSEMEIAQRWLGEFCGAFESADAGLGEGAERVANIAAVLHEKSGSTTTQELKESLAGKRPQQQAALLEKFAKSREVSFECPAFRTWLQQHGPDAG